MPSRRNLLIAVVADVVAVAVFVAIGRRSHDEGSALGGVIATALPFWFGLVAGWVAAIRTVAARRAPFAVRTGLVIWPTTVLVGMIFRRLLFADGTAVSFVIVATCVLGAFLVGWRALLRAGRA